MQSVALRLVSERETEIEAFNSQEYWSIAANFSQTTGAVSGAPAGGAGGNSPASICARLVEVDGEGLAKLAISSGEAAEALQERLEAANAGGFVVARKSEKSSKRSPPPPFITSTLQQAASSRLGFSATRTMAVAQELYEGANTGGDVCTTSHASTFAHEGVISCVEELLNWKCARTGQPWPVRTSPCIVLSCPSPSKLDQDSNVC